jgi:hypothetical protein
MADPILDPYVSNPPPPSRSPSGVARIVAAAALGAVLAGTCVFWMKPPSILPPASATRTEVAPTPNVVLAVKSLARLESVTFHMERAIDLADHQSKLFGLVRAKDAILLLAVGDVVAGCDLSTIGENDVDADFEQRRVTVRLPEPKVFSARLDEQKTRVFARKTDALASRHEDLEERARREAVKTMETAAIEAGILDRARGGAESAVKGLLTSAGFREVRIEFRSE